MIWLAGLILLIGVFALAYVNGANDISKGIATLVGSGVTNYRRAILWGTAWTMAGALIALFFSRAMMATFSKDIVGPRFPLSNAFLISVLIGAMGWVFLATKTGLPVSTTHAITGALCGAAVISFGWQGVLWLAVFQKILIPLLLSPLMAFAALWILFPALRFALMPLSKRCACAELRQAQLVAAPVACAVTEAAIPTVRVVLDHLENCQARGVTIAGIKLDDGLHWISSGLASFARGLNDAPKVVALGLALTVLFNQDPSFLFVLVALGMGLGSVTAGLLVTETLAEKITTMSAVEGLSANLITSLMVAFASRWGIPVSTTHVSSAAIIGLGLCRPHGSMQWKTVRLMLQAWIITLPASAALSSVTWWVFDKMR